MKKLILLYTLLGVPLFAAVGQKHTESTERVAVVTINAAWIEGQTLPDTATISADFRVTLVNDADAGDKREHRTASISTNALRTDRTVTIGPVSLTYRQALAFALRVVQDAYARPAQPATPTATAGNAQVALAWPAAARATTYTVQRATVLAGPYAQLVADLAVTNYTDATATNGTTYYYAVHGVNATGTGDISAAVRATPAAP